MSKTGSAKGRSLCSRAGSANGSAMPMPAHSALRGGKRQGGFALLAIISLIVLMSAYLLVKQLNASAGRTADNRNHNAKVLNQAKQALIGWVALNAAQTDNNPGRLPCPEAINSINTSSEGVSAPQIALLGPPPVPATPNCFVVGRLPWRTLGLDKLVDATAEPLWYVVSPGWALQNSSTLLLNINSDFPGQIAVDGQPAPNDVVALIIAPGPAMNVVAAGVCAARAQARSAPAPSMDPRDYIECFNSATPAFSTTGPSTSFNDQVLRVMTADLLPEIEAAITNRIQREIVPALKTVYASTLWGSGISATNPLFPYPAPFGNPSTSNFQGAAVTVVGAPQGLLPFNQTQGCNPATDVRCTTTLTAWASPSPAPPPDVTKIGGWGYFQTKTCSWQFGGNDAFCEGEYHEDDSFPSNPGMVISMTATINNVAMGLRVLDTTKATIEAENNDASGAPLTIVTPSINATMNSNGSVTITFSGTLPNIDVQGWESWALYRIRLKRSVIGDHPLLDATTVGAGSTGWFVRNEWYRHLYYALAPGHTAAGLPMPLPPTPSCTSGGTCLSVTNIAPANNLRAILILMGRRINLVPPSSDPAGYLEFGNANLPLDKVFERRPVSRAPSAPSNDRIVVLDTN